MRALAVAARSMCMRLVSQHMHAFQPLSNNLQLTQHAQLKRQQQCFIAIKQAQAEMTQYCGLCVQGHGGGDSKCITPAAAAAVRRALAQGVSICPMHVLVPLRRQQRGLCCLGICIYMHMQAALRYCSGAEPDDVAEKDAEAEKDACVGV